MGSCLIDVGDVIPSVHTASGQDDRSVSAEFFGLSNDPRFNRR